MTYARQFFSQTADPMSSLVTAIENSLTAQGNWSLFDSFAVTISGVNRTARVWKCAGTLNSTGADYFVILLPMATYSATGIQLYLTMYEGWNATTHTGTRPLNIGNTTPTGTTAGVDGFTGASVALNAAVGPEINGGFPLTTTPTDLDVFTIVNNDILAFAFSFMTSNTARSSFAWVGGCWDAGYSYTVPAGVATYGGQSATVNGKYIGRIFTADNGGLPGGKTTRSPWPQVIFSPFNVSVVPEFPTRGSLGIDSGHNQVDVVTGDITAVRLLMRQSASILPASDNSNATTLVGTRQHYDRGRLPDGIIAISENQFSSSGFAPINGDVITIGGVDYVRMGPTGTNYSAAQAIAQSLYIAKTL